MRAETRSMAQTLDNSNTQSRKGSQINGQPSQPVEPQPLIQSNIRISCRVICPNSFLGREHKRQKYEMRNREYGSSTVPSSCRATTRVDIGDGSNKCQGDGRQAAVETSV